MRRPWGSTANAVRAVLSDLGPMTRAEICRELGIERSCVSAVISRLHARGEMHIKSYVEEDECGHRYPRAVYELGKGKDAKKPGVNKGERARRYASNVRLRLTANSVFRLALTRREYLAKRVEVERR
jgi:hypothetical protein